jgi:hypothetical protein
MYFRTIVTDLRPVWFMMVLSDFLARAADVARSARRQWPA